MIHEAPKPSSIDRFKRTVLLTIIVLSLLSTVVAWEVMAARHLLSPVLHWVFGTTMLVLSALFLVAWKELLPQRVLSIGCLLFGVGICAACMALRMYSPKYGASIDLKPLYLWIPVMYVFAFTMEDRKTGLAISVGVMALFVGVSLPCLVHDIDAPYSNFTLQLHLVSAVLIAALYFFSSYQHRLLLAQLTVDQLAHLSNTDDLTKVPNRRHMAAAIETELANLANRRGGFAVMLFDIDHFKVINDRFGHGVGDAVLVALTTRAAQVFRSMDLLGRWGGDEFVVLVRDVNPEQALHMANVVCRNIAAEPLFDGHRVTISCGATVATSGDSIDSLLQRADAALYAAKRAGRNGAKSFLEAEAA
ncbi:MAG TPA: GGDEF domain-containing protein [Oleiagrimonas sp.]|nr:GGDEF domain-containing protein [Oleiagrimonas sp.]